MTWPFVKIRSLAPRVTILVIFWVILSRFDSSGEFGHWMFETKRDPSIAQFILTNIQMATGSARERI